MDADKKRHTGAHFVSVRETVQSAMAQVRKVRQQQPRRPDGSRGRPERS